jgi:peptidoglycan/LPS O-acetylase OafA/YrhL
VLTGKALENDPARFLFHHFELGRLGVTVFFIISGFLVCDSWIRKPNLISFLSSRILRVIPALVAVVLISIFIIGTVFTALSIPDYFSSPITHRYFQNITMYRLYYILPGIFVDNPLKEEINASLWTLPYEFTCYLVLLVMGLCSVLKNKYASLLFFVAAFLIRIFFFEPVREFVIPVIGIDMERFYDLLLLFLSGTMFYQFREKIPFHFFPFTLILVISFLFRETDAAPFLYLFTIPYMIFFVAFAKTGALCKIGKYGDFSYGIYLWAFPVQQTIVHFAKGNISLIVMIVLSLIFTFVLGMWSWHCIEKRALRLKKYF